MSGITSITEKIIEDGKKTAKDILAEAKSQSKEKIDEANKRAAAYLEKERLDAEKEREAIIERKVTVSNLEVGKIILAAKAETIEEVFKRLSNKLAQLNDTEYIKFIETLIEKNAEDGDSVILNVKDKKRINATIIEKIAKKKKIKLTLSDKTGDFSGGVILKNKDIDKNITFENIINWAKEEFETEVYKLLFN